MFVCIILDQYIKKTIDAEKLQVEIFSDQLTHNKIQMIVSGHSVYIAAPQEYTVQAVPISILKEKRKNNCHSEHTASRNQAITLKPIARTGKRSKSKKTMAGIFKKKNMVSLLGFVLAAVFMAISMSFGDFKAENNYSNVLQYHINTLQIDASQSFTSKDIEQIESCCSIGELLPYNSSLFFELTDGNYLQTSSTIDGGKTISTCVLNYNYAGNLIAGRLPANSYEILLDAMVANTLLSSNNETDSVTIFGYTNQNNFLNAKLKLLNSNIVLTIVGISEPSCPAIYVSPDMMISLALSNCIEKDFDIFTDYSFFGVYAPTEHQIYVSENMYIEQAYSLNDEIEIAGKTFFIAGTHSLRKDNAVIINSHAAQNLLRENYYLEVITLLVISENPVASLAALDSLGYNANSVVEITQAALNYQQNSERTARKVLAIISTLAAGIICFMTEKSKISSRIKSVAVKRAIGISKTALFGSFVYENLLEISFFAIPVYCATALLIENISLSLGNILPANAIAATNHLVGIALILIVAIIATLLSCFAFISKTPAQLIKSDIIQSPKLKY